MNFLFDFLGNIFGYALWFFFDLVGNYSVAITLFALVVNILMLPISIKRNKTMASNAKLAVKQQELQKKYGKDQKKYNEEVSNLYQKEGINPLSGCFTTMVLPLFLWGGIFGAITKPLQNTLHISAEKVVVASNFLLKIPGIGSTSVSGYEQLRIVKLFSSIKEHLTMFTQKELSSIEEFSSGFNLMGLNLLDRPNAVAFSAMLWLIPLFCFLTSILSLYITQKMTENHAQMQGCTKFMPYAMFLFTSYIAYTIPAAVGVYWIVNSVFNMLQTIFLHKYYNKFTMSAKEEYARIKLLDQKEALISKNS